MKKMKNRILAVRDGYQASFDETTRLISKWDNVINTETGIASISVNGSLSEDGGWFGGTSYALLRAEIEQDINDDKCKGIALLLNSPGGEVGGLFECASYIEEASKKKPICAQVTGMCCSAAYALAASCTSVSATPTSEIGSVGVFAQAYDDTEYLKKQGILSRIFRSKNAENKNLSAFTDEGAADIQSKVDHFEDCFYDLLSRCRGREKKECLDGFGHGSVFLADEALERGMVDAVEDYGTFMSNFASSFKDGEEEEEMDIAKMTAEEKKAVFDALVADDPSLLANAEGEASEKERERISALESQRTQANAEIIDRAVAEGTRLEEIALDLFKAEKDYAEKLAKSNLDLIAKQADNEQLPKVAGTMPDDIRAKADEVARTVSAARN